MGKRDELSTRIDSLAKCKMLPVAPEYDSFKVSLTPIVQVSTWGFGNPGTVELSKL